MDLSRISQVLGCAYTYQGSLGIRKKLTEPLKELGIHHSSQERDFSYFVKGTAETVVGNGAELRLREEAVAHWPEPELALILGKQHRIIGYTLANDFTAIGMEVRGRTAEFDGTYLGKVWPGSCSLGPRIIEPGEIDVDSMNIGLRIVRDGEILYDHQYNTQRCKRDVQELADMILAYHAEFGKDIPLSKRIGLQDGFLMEGTVILAGTGLIVPERCYSRAGDTVEVHNDTMGRLVNRIIKWTKIPE